MRERKGVDGAREQKFKLQILPLYSIILLITIFETKGEIS